MTCRSMAAASRQHVRSGNHRRPRYHNISGDNCCRHLTVNDIRGGGTSSHHWARPSTAPRQHVINAYRRVGAEAPIVSLRLGDNCRRY